MPVQLEIEVVRVRADALVLVEGVDRANLFVGEGEIVEFGVGLDALGADRFRDRRPAGLQVPAQDDLRHRFLMALGDFL